MRKLIVLLLCMPSISAFSAHSGSVEVRELRQVLQDCRGAKNEVRCLRRGIRQLVRENRTRPVQPSNLVCRSGSNGEFAVYNNDTNSYLDGYYSKTASECRQTIENAFTGYLCSVGSNNKYAVRRVSDAKFMGPSYSIDLDQCLRSTEFATSEYICIAGSNGEFARYDLQRETYLDSKYSMTLDDCLDLIP